jgi:hypothetical protein
MTSPTPAAPATKTVGQAAAAAIGAAPASLPVGEQVAIDAGNVALNLAAPGYGRLLTPVVDSVAEALIGFALRRHSHPAKALAKATGAPLTPAQPT